MSEALAPPFERSPMAYEAIAVSSTAIGCTSATLVPGGRPSATSGMFSVETNSVRFRIDGSDPSSTVGHLLAVGDYINIYGLDALQKLRFIRVTDDASVKATYFS